MLDSLFSIFTIKTVALLNPITSSQILVSLFLAILFIQSGVDKVIDWKGNLSWLKSHFEKSPLKKQVPLLLGIITLFEITAGITSGLGTVFILLSGEKDIALLGAQLSALSILMLFFGQRVAKDYPGAASLVPYFILCLVAIFLLK